MRLRVSQKIKKSEWEKKSRRSFLTLISSFFFGTAGFWILKHTEDDDEVPWPFRRILKFNEGIWRKLFRHQTNLENPLAPKIGTNIRANGDIGIIEKLDFKDWKLIVGTSSNSENISDPNNLVFNLDQLKSLNHVELTEVFKCVEGWSQVISYKGVQFSEFLTAMKLGRRSASHGADKDQFDLSSMYSFVGLKTPDESYYVSIDMESMLHPKTVLAYEMNGTPISWANGAPLRLIIPVKYGIKNLKKIGYIYFSDEQPPDYWTEQGYDWYAAL